MRPFLAVFLSLTAASLVGAADLQIVRVWPGYRTADSFVRISEFFTGKEHSGREVYLRSQPDQRAGLYFLTRVDNDGAPAPIQFRLSVISPQAPRPVTYTYTADVPRGNKVFQLGITGSDWPVAADHPVAWKLELLSNQGEALATHQSFLWSKPDKK